MSEVAPSVIARAATAVAEGDADAFVACCTEDVTIEALLGEVEGAYRGREGARAWLDDRAAAWATISFAFEPFTAAGPPGGWIAEGRLSATSREGGISLEQPVTGGVRVEDGRIAWLGFFRSAQEALERLRHSTRDPAAGA